jgi:hypothetical protein
MYHENGRIERIKKKPADWICRILPSFEAKSSKQKGKGEEKPEEELMGKRKSSPRLATTPSQLMLSLSLWSIGKKLYSLLQKNSCQI